MKPSRPSRQKQNDKIEKEKARSPTKTSHKTWAQKVRSQKRRSQDPGVEGEKPEGDEHIGEWPEGDEHECELPEDDEYEDEW